jgi:tetratricopeptide (TPR) repeat protein
MTRASFSLLAALIGAVAVGCSGPSALEQAQAAYDVGDYTRAIERSTAAVDGGDKGGYLLRGKCYEKKGEPLKAVADYDHARQVAPDQGEPAFREAKCYLAAGRPTDAESTISGVIKDKLPNYSVRDQMLAHAVHGEIRMAVGDFPRASESFGEALKVARISKPLEAEPATGIVHYNLSKTYFEQGAYRRARDSFQAYIDVQQSVGGGADEQDFYTLAVLHFLSEDVAACRKVAVNLGPEAKARLDAILSGDTFSVGALYDLKQKQKDKDAGKEQE